VNLPVELPAIGRHPGAFGSKREDMSPVPAEAGKLARTSASEPGSFAPSPVSQRGLDWFMFFVSDVQTGFGPFISVYLTTQKWTQADIGLALTAGSLVSLAGQMPGGALVDYVRSERFVAAIAVAVVGATAAFLAAWPLFAVALAVQVLHAAASCVLGPALAAISLGLVGHRGIAERLGRNACFKSIGNGVAAAAMGAIGHFYSSQAVFYLTFALCGPALIALFMIKNEEINPAEAHGGVPDPSQADSHVNFRALARNRPLVVLAACVVLFHLANAAMLPLIASTVTMRSADWATVLVAACIVLPQALVAITSPWVGRRAEIWGRRPLLLLGFAALPIRGLLVAFTANPYLLALVQTLDGISAAAIGVLVPLVIADATRGTGRFNLAQGIVGTGMGIGASFSTTLAGYASDRMGPGSAFLILTAVALVGLLLAWLLLPETRPNDGSEITNNLDTPAVKSKGARAGAQC
jgi:predicted MFS family arabinose efflux permease